MVQKHPVRAHEHHVTTVLGAGEVFEHSAVPFPSPRGGRRPPRQRRRNPGLGQSCVGGCWGENAGCLTDEIGCAGKWRDSRQEGVWIVRWVVKRGITPGSGSADRVTKRVQGCVACDLGQTLKHRRESSAAPAAARVKPGHLRTIPSAYKQQATTFQAGGPNPILPPTVPVANESFQATRGQWSQRQRTHYMSSPPLPPRVSHLFPCDWPPPGRQV